jgi:hypothetical protein
MFDTDGDGIPERLTFSELSDIANRPMSVDDKGKAIFYPKGTTKQAKADADGIFQDLLEKDKAEGKDDTPQRRIELRQQAIKLAAEAKPPAAVDPLLEEMRRLRLDNMRRTGVGQDLTPAQIRAADSLADNFARDSKDFMERANSYGTVLAAGKDPSAAGDLSLIFAYMKMLDPGSVVREGEFATAQNTAGVPDRIRNVYNKLINGERLTPGQRADFTKQAQAIYGGAKRRNAAIMRTYTQRAIRAKLPPEMVVLDYGEGVEDDAVAASSSSMRNKLGLPPKQ